MKGFAACLRPSLHASKQSQPCPNVIRSYANVGLALETPYNVTFTRAKLNILKTRNPRFPNGRLSRCFCGLPVTPILAESRISDMRQHEFDHQWPRIKKQDEIVSSFHEFHEKYKRLPRGQTLSEELQLHGRIWGFRTGGDKLAFVDLVQENVKVQVVCNYQTLAKSGVGLEDVKNFVHTLKRGNIISVVGHPYRTQRNELSILISEIPLLLSACVRPLPLQLTNKETRMRLRHVDLLIHQQAADILKLGSGIKKFLRNYLEEKGHISIRTPILADGAGGAVARPFYTKGFEGRDIALRIAPELWLKRLIIGGFERVYEIGPSFRNEGIDNSHNPEFETCEFYQTYADLEQLIGMTEEILYRISVEVKPLEDINFKPPRPRLDFIPAIEADLGCKLPLLSSLTMDPVPIIIKLMQDRSIGIPQPPTLPRLLDKLCSHFLEPRCHAPTWIVNHPECLSPLSKSFTHEATGQVVAARAELFVQNQELVNTYEEENSPIAQRKKFINQLNYNEAENLDGKVDESYLEALEYGMPPTGGWGCGIERLVMLFGGTGRIADTLAFGTLKNVVALGSHERTPLPLHGKPVTDDDDSLGDSEKG